MPNGSLKVGERVICKRCGHDWAPRVWPVRKCPKCQSYKWQVPKAK